MRKKYNTPHRSRVVKTRMTEEEYVGFAARLAPYGISQSEFIRRAIQGASIRPVVTVSPVNDELLAALGRLTAEYGRIGNNLKEWSKSFRYLQENDLLTLEQIDAAVAEAAEVSREARSPMTLPLPR